MFARYVAKPNRRGRERRRQMGQLMVRQFDTAGWAYNYCIHSPAPARLDPSVPFLYPHLLELHPRSRTYDNIGREKHPRISR